MLKTLFEGSHDAVVVLDDERRCVDANPAACRVFGVSHDSLLARRFDDLVEGGDRASGAWQRLLEKGADAGDAVIRSSVGEVPVEYWARAHFAPGRHLFVLHDLTRQRAAERELLTSGEFLRRVIESSHDCIKVLDLDGRLLSMNEGGRRLLEIESLEPYLGSSWLDLWTGEDRARAVEAIERARNGEATRFEAFGTTAAGSPRYWDTSVAPINAADGRPERLIAISRDVTDRVHAARAAEAASRVKDEFLAVLAHELRNPLSAILTSVAALDVIGALAPPAVQARAVIRRQTEHMAGLLDDLLDVARIGQGKIELQATVVDLAEIVERAFEAERHRFESRHQRARVEVPRAPVAVRGDAVRLRQVVLNLVGNAAKYTPDGGSILVRVAVEAEEAVLTVSDTGIGVPADKLSSIFELFTQVKTVSGRTEGNLGIGLALVKRLTELHGGTVSARSEGEGKGTELEVRLPRAAEVLREAARPERAALPRRRILVIEDNADARDVLAMALALGGHEVTSAGSAREGLEMADRQRPDVVIVDIGLPDASGYDVGRRLREVLGREATLFAFSGHAQPEDRRQSKEAGFDAHLVKPLAPDALLALLGRDR